MMEIVKETCAIETLSILISTDSKHFIDGQNSVKRSIFNDVKELDFPFLKGFFD